jgi:DNA-binding FadR family transcriptional regulator
MAVSLKPIVTGGVAKQIATNIREAIMDGRLKVDERLPTEEELASQFGVSRPTIREALKRLAAQNLVRSQRGPSGGTFVVRPTEEQISSSLASSVMLFMSLGEVSHEHLSEARESMERICSRLAASHRTDEDLAAMESQLAIQRDPSVSDVTFCFADLRFHKAIVESTRNPFMRLLMASVIETLQTVSNMASYPFAVRKQILAQHEKIFRAIRDREPDAAESAVIEQMRYLAESYAKGKDWRQTRKGLPAAAAKPKARVSGSR